MSILTALFQAVGQAIAWIFPISEGAHSAIFHNFSGRFTNACSQLTGIVHIGIAVGLFIAFFRLFVTLFKNFFGAWSDVFHKRLDLKNVKPAREFMYMTILSFVPMLLYPIPVGKGENVYSVLHSMSYNTTVLDEGVFMLVSAALIFGAVFFAGKIKKPLPAAAQSLIIGTVMFFAVAIAGLSVFGAIFCTALLTGIRTSNSLRYGAVESVLVLLVMGVTELFTAVTDVGVVSAIIALIVSAATAFFVSKLLVYFVKNQLLRYFGIYDATVGALCIIIGAVQILIG